MKLNFGVAMYAAALFSGAVQSDVWAREKDLIEPAEAGRNVIAFYGDSTIRGYQANTGKQVRRSTPQAFAVALPCPTRYRVLNEGVDSSRVEHLLAGTDGRHETWEAHMAKSKADIVITNHASKNGNPVAQYESDLRKLTRIARKHGKRVIFMTPNPIAEGGLEAYVDAMRAVARSEAVPLIDVFGYLRERMATAGMNITDLVPDGYHPGDRIYVLIGDYAAKKFSENEGLDRGCPLPTAVR